MAAPKGNKFGPLPVGDDLRQARKLTKAVFEEIAHRYLFMTYDDMVRLLSDKSKNLPAIDYLVLSIIMQGIKEGDVKRLDFFIERTIRRSVRSLRKINDDDDDADDEDDAMPKVKAIPVPMTKDERIEMLEKMRQRLLNDKIDEETIIDIDVEPSK